MKFTETANRVIELARQLRAFYEAELPKRYPNYPVIDSVGEIESPPEQEKKLIEFLSSLPSDTIYQLISIMYLGRGDFEADELAEHYEVLKNTIDEPEFAISQMIDKAPLGDYLADGLEELRKHDMNADELPLAQPAVRKR